jgi:drug/metabolite transporter (DMT)-like permease
MSIFNQYSAVFIVLIIGLLPIGLLLRRTLPQRRPFALFGGLVLLGGIMFLFLRPDTNGVKASEVEVVLAGNGRLALLELYSDY